MLIHALYLSVSWFAISLIATLAAGHRLRQGHILLSLFWLVIVILAGDLLAWFIFHSLLEIIALSAIAAVLGIFWILRLADWNALGQVTWITSQVATALFIIYAFILTAFSPLNPLSFLFAIAFFFIEAITLLLALAHLHESLDVACRIHWHRLITD